MVELVAIAFMLGAGGALAIFVTAAVAIARREAERDGPERLPGASERERIAVSLLFRLLTAGGVASDEALRQIRRRAGLAAPVTAGIDMASWSESYARQASLQDRARLLETAVQLIATTDKPVPLGQYSLLLDLSFGLGFQTDALAKLREQYKFTYVDHAKNARPREADRGTGGTPLFVREPRRRDELLAKLGITGEPSRATIIAAYRRLAAEHHPDRYHGRSAEVQSDAASRFIELTRAYEELLLQYRD